MFKRVLIIVVSVLAVLALLLGGAIAWRSFATKDWVAKSTDVAKYTADDHALISEAQFNTTTEKYFKSNILASSTVVPGVRGAWSINKSGQAEFGTNWVPQGIAISDKYLFISVYDHDKKLNSVIFEVDRASGKYVKSLILNNKSHLGGLAYDSEHQRLWASTDKKGARLSTYDQTTIDQYDAAVSKAPLKADKVFSLPWWSNSSAISLYQNDKGLSYLSIAKYDSGQAGGVVEIPLNIDGFIDMSDLPNKKLAGKTNKQIQESLKNSGLLDQLAFSVGLPKMQGIATYQSYAIFTQSNGVLDAKLTFAQRQADNSSKTLTNFKFVDLSGELKVPNSIEQVAIAPDKKSIFLLFESSARPYRLTSPVVMDRVVQLKVDFTKAK